MIEMKHYYKYVVDYIIKLLEIHSQETKAKNISISTSEYIELITFFNTKRNIFSKDVEKALSKQSSVLRVNFDYLFYFKYNTFLIMKPFRCFV